MWGQPPLRRAQRRRSAVQPGRAELRFSRLSSGRHEVLKAWIAAILWLIVISIESSTLLSAHNTSRILYPILHFLFGIDWERFGPWHFFIRKSGHVIGYAILSILLFRAWRATWAPSYGHRWTARWAGAAILGTLLVATLDEWHQSFLPSRTGKWQDVVLDTCAGMLAQALLLFLGNFTKRSSAEPAANPAEK